jgi:uncharacterized protein
VDRVFLDANVLFSAAYMPTAGLQKLWTLHEVALLTSAYALEEARAHLQEHPQRERLRDLMDQVKVVSAVHDDVLPQHIVLLEKDRPMLLAAIGARASHLLMGDVTHFGSYYEKTINGVLILRPAAYLRRHASWGG